jgi:probable F420-dependent oxidoreductase
MPSVLVKLDCGLRLPTFATKEKTASLDEIVRYVQKAEAAGVTSIFLIDHLLTTPPAYTNTWLEPFTLLAALAPMTHTLKLGTLVTPLPLRHPVTLAKALATLDFLSKGRLILGVGVGWAPNEFEVMGVPLKERAPRTNETIEILQRLWTEDSVSYDGKFFTLRDITIEPKPARKPHPPIWIGGGTQYFETTYGQKMGSLEGVYRRIAKYADCWSSHAPITVEMLRQDWERISEYAIEYGRDPNSIERVYNNFVYFLRKGQTIHDAIPDFRQFSGMTPEYWQKNFLVGTVHDIDRFVERVGARMRAVGGMQHVVLNTVTFDDEQLEPVVTDLFPKLRKLCAEIR